MIGRTIEPYVRFAGDLMNVLLLAVFAVAAFKLHAMAGAYLAAAGGLPHPSISYLEQLALSPDAPDRIVLWAAAWLCWIGALGSAWMALLGARWAYHALLRILAA